MGKLVSSGRKTPRAIDNGEHTYSDSIDNNYL